MKPFLDLQLLLRRFKSLGLSLALAVLSVSIATAQHKNTFNPGDSADWTIRSGALFLDCGGELPNTLLLTRGDLTPVLRSNEIDGGIGAGWELQIGKKLSNDYSLEARYFSIDSYDDRLLASGLINGAGVRYSNTVAGVLGAVTGAYDLHYGADVESVEVMVRRRTTDWMHISAGVRHFEFDDNIFVTISGGGFTARSLLAASNALTGGQLGTDILLLEFNRLSVSAKGLAGIYYNDMRTRLTQTTNITRTSTFGDSRTSFLGEIELTSRYQLTKRLSIEGGYRILFIEDIALASEQAAINPLPGFGAMRAIDSTDSRTLQGATTSFVFTF